MLGLHRDINLTRNYLPSRRVQKPRERTGDVTGPGTGRYWAPALPPGPIRVKLGDHAPPT